MLNIYSQFRDFHVFKRFKYLFGDWWNIDIFIVVKSESKFLYDGVRQIKNPIINDLLLSPLFKSHFIGSLKNIFNQKDHYMNPKLVVWKQTGLELFTAPLELKEGPFQAVLVATGFAPKKEEELYQSLLYLGLSKEVIEQRIKGLKKLDSSDKIYMQKMLTILAEEFLQLLKEKNKQENLISELNYKNSFKKNGQLIGKSSAMQYIFTILKKIKNYDSTILIEGEKGTGKRLLAKTIHEQSARSKKDFFIQNFSTFKGSLLELELFGYKKKAFPSARKDKKAMLEKTDGGTVFLNEIGHTSLAFQEKLLRFLKDAVFVAEGETSFKKANVRIICSSSVDLKTLIEQGKFNKALYFAISAMVIKTPSLTSRKEDIPILMQHFLQSKASSNQKLKFSAKALELMYNYSWPGNIRELESEAARLAHLITAGQYFISDQDLSLHIRNSLNSWNQTFELGERNLKDVLRHVEKQVLLDTLKKNNWNKSRVAKLLGTSRTSIILKTKEYGMIKEEGA